MTAAMNIGEHNMDAAHSAVAFAPIFSGGAPFWGSLSAA
jgi:hypothetical protein